MKGAVKLLWLLLTPCSMDSLLNWWVDALMDAWMASWLDAWLNACEDAWKDAWIDAWMASWVDAWLVAWIECTDGFMGWCMAGCMDRMHGLMHVTDWMVELMSGKGHSLNDKQQNLSISSRMKTWDGGVKGERVRERERNVINAS